MNYDSPGRKTLDRPVEIDDVCDFFKDFMLNDRLGQIDNLHLAFADSNPEGVRFAGCVKLAELVRDYYIIFFCNGENNY